MERFNLKQKVIVIGGGIAGLSAGIFAQKCGFDTTILESHNIAGGICTSWKRKGYLFEGGMHWLAGSSEKQPMNKLWRYVGAIDDSVKFSYFEPFVEYRHEGIPIRIYRDVDTTERHLLELSPADAKEIKIFCNNIRSFKNLVDPITDIKGVKVVTSGGIYRKNRMSLSALFSMMPVMKVMIGYSKVSVGQYADRFKHEGIRGLFRALPGNEQGVAMFIMTMGALSRKDGGFPEGGSLPFAGRMVKTFTASGGEILYNTRAGRVVMKNGKTVGVKIEGSDTFISADAVIITSDTMASGRFFDTPPKAPWLDQMRKITEPTTVTFVSLGINADLKHYPKGMLITLKNPIKLSTFTYNSLLLSSYAADPHYSPEGKSVITVQLPGDSYDYWEKLKDNGQYAAEKQRVGNDVIAAITKHIPEMEGKVEVCDVATPLTYERYCGNWKGSWMTAITPNTKFKPYPAAIKGLGGVYFAGQRMLPPGGIPTAMMTARTAVQHLCRDTGAVFVCEE
ncbi:MAG: NAD(P)/FAD-dependent oxidoreductase [Lachnospiraceae bacterium]|nr:NAD(P)/FAD-dependent oxidoreductase [Lachnospiraceae bacterium]